jgi:hypothetical protein
MLESTTLDNLKHLKWKNFYYGNDVFCGAMGVDDVLLASPWNTVNEVFACFNALYVKDGNVWSHIFDSISLDVGPSGVASEVPKELYEDVYEVANDLDESVSEVTKELDQLNVLQGETKESKLETL